MTTTTTPEQALADLRQRIADGDNTVTAAELQQAESAVQIAGLQAEGRERREAEAEHQTKVDELAEIRKAVENELPDVSGDVLSRLEKIDKLTAETVALAKRHDSHVNAYAARIKQLAAEGVEIEGLEWSASGIIAGSRVVGRFSLAEHITRAARHRADFPQTPLALSTNPLTGAKLASPERTQDPNA